MKTPNGTAANGLELTALQNSSKVVPLYYGLIGLKNNELVFVDSGVGSFAGLKNNIIAYNGHLNVKNIEGNDYAVIVKYLDGTTVFYTTGDVITVTSGFDIETY